MIKNNSESTIQSRILSIKKLLINSSLQSINLLKEMDVGMDTEFFEGPKDIKDHKSLLPFARIVCCVVICCNST